MPPLRLGNLQLKGWAELTGPLVKAANTKHLNLSVEVLANKYFDDAADLHHVAMNE